MSHQTFRDDSETELAPKGTNPNELAAFRLVVVDGADRAKTLMVDGSATPPVVGKSAASELALTDARVSRRHASFDVVDDLLRVTDLTSKNGTFVNGVRVSEAFVKGGETVMVGSTQLRVERVASTATPLGPGEGFGRLLGASPAMRRLHAVFERLAATEIPVVIQGETGTGKELLAEALHESGPRKAAPFIVLDCGSVTPAEVEPLLFGDERTGSRGVFEQAHQGTLLIDEITELPTETQRKLHRAIERGEVCRVGSDKWMKVDVRVIATTRRDIEKEVEDGRFREDLFFRLAVGRVELPPLRRRIGDVERLAEHFAKGALPGDFLRRYEGYGWPGNVRELQNAVLRRLALGDADPDAGDKPTERDGAPEHAFRWVLEQDMPFTSARDLVTAEFERAYVARVLAEHGGNVSRAAIASGLARRYFQIIRARQR
jgi:two-component system, NtrC family, response regulator HydG